MLLGKKQKHFLKKKHKSFLEKHISISWENTGTKQKLTETTLSTGVMDNRSEKKYLQNKWKMFYIMTTTEDKDQWLGKKLWTIKKII